MPRSASGVDTSGVIFFATVNDTTPSTYVGLPGVSSQLRQQQVDTEGGILIVQSLLDSTDLAQKDTIQFAFVSDGGKANLLLKDFGSVTVSTDDPQPTMVRHRSSQLWPTCDVHSYSSRISNLPRAAQESPN